MTHAAAAAISGFYFDHRRRLKLWALLLLVTLTALILRDSAVLAGLLPGHDVIPTAWVLISVFFAALVCEYMDSSLGMGYGTTLTQLLLIAGFHPIDVVPAVLLSELATGVAAGALHQRDGNLDLRNDRRARQTLLLLAGLSGVGAIIAALIAVSISKFWLTLAITAIILSMGVLTLVTAGRRIRYRPGSVLAVGLVAAFNKGLSGGGYGPLVTSGQVISGVPARTAVGITSMAEAVTCLVALGTYVALGNSIAWGLALPLMAGALLSVPLATVTVRRLPETLIRRAVGTLTLLLGLIALAKLVG